VVILDDFAARKAAMELGLKVKGTLGIIKKLLEENKIKIEDINKLYETLKKLVLELEEKSLRISLKVLFLLATS